MVNKLDSLREALRQVIEPEVGMNIVDLGLVYYLEHTLAGVQIAMTMVSPGFRMADRIVEEVRAALEASLPPATMIDVKLVWEPAWSPWLMSDVARAYFGWSTQ